MNPKIERSRNYILSNTKYIIDEDTFQVLDEEQIAWIAHVTTTHFQEIGKPEQSYYILVFVSQHIVLNDEALAQLGTYITNIKSK